MGGPGRGPAGGATAGGARPGFPAPAPGRAAPGRGPARRRRARAGGRRGAVGDHGRSPTRPAAPWTNTVTAAAERGGSGRMSLRIWRTRRRPAPIVCRDAVALMADYLEGDLAPADVVRLEGHLAGCPHCSEYLAQLRATIKVLGYAEPDALSDEAVDAFVGLYHQWRSGEGS